MSKCNKAIAGWQCTRESGHPGPCAAKTVWTVPLYKMTIRYKGHNQTTWIEPVDSTIIDYVDRNFRKGKKVRLNWNNAIFMIDFKEVAAVIYELIEKGQES